MPTGVRVDINAGDGWEDITRDCLTRDPITITQGSSEYATQADPGTCSMTLRNLDGKYSPGNPLSPYFGKLGRNTPIRVTIPGGEQHLRITGTPGKARTVSSSALDISGDLDVRVDCSLDSWQAPGDTAPMERLALAGRQSATGLSWRLCLSHTGQIILDWSSTGGTSAYTNAYLSDLVAIPASGRVTLRATLVVDNGDDAFEVAFWTGESVDGPWTQVGPTYVNTSGPTGVASVTAPLEIGHVDNTERPSAVGRIYRAQVRDGIDGLIVANPDFTSDPALGATSWTDDDDLTWTLIGDAEISDRMTRFRGEVVGWPEEWAPSGEDPHVPLQAAGILRRLGKSRRADESGLRRRIMSLDPAAYWPMEPDTRAGSPLLSGSPLVADLLDWGAESSLASSAPLPKVDGTDERGAFFYGAVPPPAAPIEAWQVQMMYRLDTAPEEYQTIARILTSGTVATWLIQVQDDGSRVVGYDAEGTEITSTNVGTGLDIFGQWCRLGFWVQDLGDDIAWRVEWADAGGDSGGLTGMLSDVLTGVPVAVAAPAEHYSAEVDGMAIGHVAVWHHNVSAATMLDASIASWAGDTAVGRMRRVADESGLPLVLYGVEVESERVGGQSAGRPLEVLAEAADADGGILFESREALGLAYRSRGTLYSQAPVMTLRYGTAHEVQPPMRPVPDDSGLCNDGTVSRSGGSSARVVQDEGRMTPADPPVGIGQYESSRSLSLYRDAQAEPQAGWMVHLGTVEQPRYPTLRMDLVRASHLLRAACATSPGDRIVVTDMPRTTTPDDVDVMAMGHEEVIGVHTHTIEFNAVPYQPWLVAVVEEPSRGRADTSGSALAAGVDADDAVLSVAGPAWVAAEAALNADASFALGLGGWVPNGADAEVIAMESPGLSPNVLMIDPDGLSSFPRAESEVLTGIVPGQRYIISAWLYCTSSRYNELNANWFDNSGFYVDTSATGYDAVAGVWMWVQGVITAPSGVARATIAPTVPSADTDEILYVTQVSLRPWSAGSSPLDFPLDLRVGGERMTCDAIGPGLSDLFGRSASSGWGTATSGQSWSTSGGSAAQYSVAGGAGLVSQGTVNVARYTLAPSAGADVDIVVTVATDKTPAGGSHFVGPVARYADASNMYLARLEVTTASAVNLTLRKRVSGTESALGGTIATGITHAPGTEIAVRLRITGSLLQARAWLASGTEPTAWQTQVTDTSLTAAGSVGTRSILSVSNTNTLPVVASWRAFADEAAPQRFAVARSANGVVKSHGAGADVRLADPPIVAL